MLKILQCLCGRNFCITEKIFCMGHFLAYINHILGGGQNFIKIFSGRDKLLHSFARLKRTAAEYQQGLVQIISKNCCRLLSRIAADYQQGMLQINSKDCCRLIARIGDEYQQGLLRIISKDCCGLLENMTVDKNIRIMLLGCRKSS